MSVRKWLNILAFFAVAVLVGSPIELPIGSSAGWAADLDPKGVAFFERSIRPVLVAECYECHATNSKKIEGGLVLDNEAGLLTGGESGPAVVPGNPAKSLIVEALRHEGLEMPPKKKLPDAVIIDFTKWIRMGAPYPGNSAAELKWQAMKQASQDEARQFWSFQPIADPDPPAVKDSAWALDRLDQFVLAGQELAGVRPVSDADPRVLIRRLYFDLVGLPPAPAQVQAFEQSAATDRQAAVRSVVDELLDSPRFGEHWGRHWLDVARYAESNGNVDNELFPHAWRYRDWVISAFNRGLPWDKFVIHQVAGDLLPAETTQERNDQLVATGLLALTSRPRPQGNPNYQMDLVSEQIDTVTMSFVALTVGCARCHDHKFDPIPTAEFYQLAAIFEGTEMMHGGSGRQGNNTNKAAVGELLRLASLDRQQADKVREYEEQKGEVARDLARARAEMNRLTGGSNKNKKAKKNKPAKGSDEGKAARNLSPEDRERLVGVRQEVEDLQARLTALDENAPAASGFCMGARDRGQPVEGHIRIRGESTSVGDSVPRGFTTVGYVGPPPKIPETQSGRLEFAQWIASPHNTLTARVAVNRVWRHLFGTGIVKSVDNFGRLGELPTNLPLLDHLATRFMRDGWSVKQTIREICLSRTYQLSSQHDATNNSLDPDNRLLWRHDVRRLDAEPFRDTVLAIAGSLETTPPTGSMVEQHGSILVQNGNQQTFSEFDHRHRSIYLPIVRSAEPEMLHVFDLPDPELVIGDRSVTNVPAQSLFLMNSRFMVEQATLFAKRVLAETPDDAGRAHAACRLAYGRTATEDELASMRRYLGRGSDTNQRWAEVCQMLLASAEFRYIE